MDAEGGKTRGRIGLCAECWAFLFVPCPAMPSFATGPPHSPLPPATGSLRALPQASMHSTVSAGWTDDRPYTKQCSVVVSLNWVFDAAFARTMPAAATATVNATVNANAAAAATTTATAIRVNCALPDTGTMTELQRALTMTSTSGPQPGRVCLGLWTEGC